MKHSSYLLCIAVLFICLACQQKPSFENKKISLNGDWSIAETNNPDSIPVTFGSTIQVPSFIDMATPKFPKLDYPNDSARYFWYHKTFSVDAKDADVVELELRKVKYEAHIFVNGKKAGQQNIAFSSGKFNIKNLLNSDDTPNDLLIRIGTRENFTDTLISGADFEKKTFLPGIYDNVNLLVKKTPYIDHLQILPDINSNTVSAFVDINRLGNETPFNVAYQVLEHNTQKLIASGEKEFTTNAIQIDIPLENYELWSPENPFLYDLKLSTSTDTKTTRFGMRSFTVDNKNKRFVLNNKPYFLLGTNVPIYRFFEDENRGDKPWDEQWVRKLFTQFKAMNWNSFRFHVGTAPDLWYNIADEMGLLIQDEYSIWYGKDGVNTLDKKITSKQLAVEYEHWMRDRWNHPSIVIWDAQNETVSRITGPAYEMVRDLDKSNRVWDNGYSRPTRPTDIMEAHPYLLYPYHLKDAKNPKEGIYKKLMGEVRLPSNDPNEQDPPKDGKPYENTIILNEYCWLWLNRDGSPTTLTDNVYSLLFKEADTPEKRFTVYAQTLAALTEYWRAHKKVAGIHHFAGLTYSRPNEPRGETSDCFKDLESLEFQDAFVKYAKPAFSKVGLMADTWEKEYKAGQQLELPIYVSNDSDNLWKGNITIAIYNNQESISESSITSEVEPYKVKVEKTTIELPKTAGTYELQVSLNYNGKKVTSYRNLNIK